MQLDLSTLSTTELRQLLDSARSRGQASQSYLILQEMAARREAAPKPRKPARRPTQPRVISLDLGDPLEPRDELIETARHDDLEISAMPVADSSDDPIAGLTLGGGAAQAPPPFAAPRKPRSRFAVFAAGAALGVVAGWAGATASSGHAPFTGLVLPEFDMAEVKLPKLALPDLGAFVGGSASGAEPAGDIRIAELPPAPTGEAAPPAGLEIIAAPADAMGEAQDVSASAPLPEAIPEPAPILAVPPPPPPPEEATNDCAAEPTPADRTICAEPGLQKLQRELRQAYARALDAHADRATLRQRQLAWRDARDGVDDPQELAALYESRIRKLNTATAEAKRLAAR